MSGIATTYYKYNKIQEIVKINIEIVRISTKIVGNTGAVVQPGDPVALAEAWAKILELDDKNRAALGAVACRRAVETFRLEDVIERYQILYEQMASSGECKTGQT